MKRIHLVLALPLLLTGCYQKPADLTVPLQQLTQATQQLNQKVDAVADRLEKVESINSTNATSYLPYSDDRYFFAVSYPSTWQVITPESITQGQKDYVVSFYGDRNESFSIVHYASFKDSEEYIKTIGDQWGANRNEKRTTVNINGIEATRVVVTGGGEEYPDWYAEEIVIPDTLSGGSFFVISNGAVRSLEFEKFYSSFTLLNYTQ